jgi:hypothetical protein
MMSSSRAGIRRKQDTHEQKRHLHEVLRLFGARTGGHGQGIGRSARRIGSTTSGGDAPHPGCLLRLPGVRKILAPMARLPVPFESEQGKLTHPSPLHLPRFRTDAAATCLSSRGHDPLPRKAKTVCTSLFLAEIKNRQKAVELNKQKPAVPIAQVPDRAIATSLYGEPNSRLARRSVC